MKRFTTILAILLAASIAWGEEPSRFLIERIEVRGVARARPEIVIAESRLSEGQEYDEREIDEATYRIRRLPFVRDVSAALEKGGERGRYVLVLSIDETRPFFVGLITTPWTEEDDTALLAGWRWFPGSNTVVHTAATMFETEGIEVGITQYGLLGKGSFLYASLGYGLWDSVNENDEGTLRPELLLAIPLSANDALRIRAVSEGRIFTKLDGEEVELREHTFSLSWVRDLTDDPFFPTVGFAATAGIEHAIGDDFAYGLSGTAGGEVTKLRADVTRSALVGSLVQYVRIGTGSSIWGSANLRFGRNDWSERVVGGTEEDRFAGTVRAGWVGGPASWMGNPSYDLRFEAGAVYNYEQWSRTNTLKGNVERAGLRVGVAFRNDWAVIRFVGEWFPHEDYNR